MSERAANEDGLAVPATIRWALALAVLGTAVCLALLVKETPYTLVAFMFVAQPLLAAAAALFLAHVLRDLRRTKLL